MAGEGEHNQGICLMCKEYYGVVTLTFNYVCYSLSASHRPKLCVEGLQNKLPKAKALAKLAS